MKKTAIKIAAVASVFAASLAFMGCPSTPDEKDPVENEKPSGEDPSEKDPSEKDPSEKDPATETGSEADLAEYVYHRSISGWTDSWSSGSTITDADGKVSIVNGTGWGDAGVACGVANVELGEIADYKYIVFTLDESKFEVNAPLDDLASNTGVNIKVPEVLKRPSKSFTKDGKKTYYIETSEFDSASAATSIALIVGGKGTLVVEDFYLAAKEKPADKVVEYKNTTVYTAGDTLQFTAWGVGVSAECKEEGIVATGASAYYAVNPKAPVQFKAGASLEVTYTANAEWKIKPVAPEVETALPAGTDVTKKVSLGDANGILSAIGLVLGTADVNVTITSIRVVDNE